MTKLISFNKDDINQKTLFDDYKVYGTSEKIYGWSIGHPVAATGPNNIAIRHGDFGQIPQDNGKFVPLRNAVRLMVDYDGYGNIWHAFNAEAGHNYIFTWYDLADYVDGDGTNIYNSTYHVHIARDGHQIHDDTFLSKSDYTARRVWQKKTLTYNYRGAGETLYISFQSKKIDNRNQGPLITLVKGYRDREDDSDDTDVSNFRLVGPAPETLLLEKNNSADAEVENVSRWEFSLQQTPDSGRSWNAPDDDHTVRFRFQSDVTTSGDNRAYWQHTQAKGDKHFYLGLGAIHARAPTQDTPDSMTAVLLLGDETPVLHQIMKVGYFHDGTFTQYGHPDKAIPFTLKGAAAAELWTISGTLPTPISAETRAHLKLLKNGNPSGKQEQLTVRPDTNQYLTVDPLSVTSETDGTFTLRLTPKAQQTGTTTLTLIHAGKDLSPPYTIDTVALPVSKYDIRVYDDSDNLIDLSIPHRWPDNEQSYVTLAVVKHETSEEVDADEVTVSVSPAGAITPSLSSVKFVKGKRAQARVDFTPSGGGKVVTITFQTPESKAVLNIILGMAGGQLEVVKGNPLLLSPDIDRTLIGEQAVLDVRFNPQYRGGTPPTISFQVIGHGLHIWNKNVISTSGELTPDDPDKIGDYRIQPQLHVDDDASKTAWIRFFIDPSKYPEASATYGEVTVPVNFSRISKVKWSVPNNTIVDAGSITALKTKLQVLDERNNVLSAFLINVDIVALGKSGATYISGLPTHCVLSGPDRTGWASLPEMQVKHDMGSFSLQATLPEGKGPLPDILSLEVTSAQNPVEILMHPQSQLNAPVDITWGDLDGGGYSKDASRYAQLNITGHQPAHSGKIIFILNADNNAGAKMANPDPGETYKATVDVNTATGRALWPAIIIGNPGSTFRLTAHSESVVIDVTVEFNVS